jgi:hypothetical protein
MALEMAAPSSPPDGLSEAQMVARAGMPPETPGVHVIRRSGPMISAPAVPQRMEAMSRQLIAVAQTARMLILCIAVFIADSFLFVNAVILLLHHYFILGHHDTMLLACNAPHTNPSPEGGPGLRDNTLPSLLRNAFPRL